MLPWAMASKRSPPKTPTPEESTERITVVVTTEVAQRLDYWAGVYLARRRPGRRGRYSRSDLVSDLALEHLPQIPKDAL